MRIEEFKLRIVKSVNELIDVYYADNDFVDKMINSTLKILIQKNTDKIDGFLKMFQDANGEIDEIFEEDLPYDLNQETIVLDNQGYGIWYLDAMDHLERYIGKKLQFVAMVLKPENFPDGYFVPGRMAMTCCAEDMAFLGYACEFAGAGALRQKEWVKVTATVSKEYWEDYKGEGPILHAVSVEKTKAPKDEVISFT